MDIKLTFDDATGAALLAEAAAQQVTPEDLVFAYVTPAVNHLVKQSTARRRDSVLDVIEKNPTLKALVDAEIAKQPASVGEGK